MKKTSKLSVSLVAIFLLVMAFSVNTHTAKAATPTVTFTADGSTSLYILPNGGGTFHPSWTNFSWTSNGATSCSAASSLNDWTGVLATSNSIYMTTLSTSLVSHSYTVTCTGLGGSASATVNVKYYPAPTVRLTSDPTVEYDGNINFQWSSTNTEFCDAGHLHGWNDWTTVGGANPTSGSVSVQVAKAYSGYDHVGYMLGSTLQIHLRCYSPAFEPTFAPDTGRLYADTTIFVPVNTVATLSIKANPTLVSFNGSSVISWTAHNVVNCYTSGGGNIYASNTWPKSSTYFIPPPLGAVSSLTVNNIQVPGDFTLNCYGPLDGYPTAVATAHVDVTPLRLTLATNPPSIGSITGNAFSNLNLTNVDTLFSCGGQAQSPILCSANLPYQGVTLSSYPARASDSNPSIDYSFSSWSGDSCSGSTNDKCTVTIDANKTVTANYVLKAPYITLWNTSDISEHWIDPGQTGQLFATLQRAVSCTGTSVSPSGVVGPYPTNPTTGDWANGKSGYVYTPALNTLGKYTYSLTCTNSGGSTSATTNLWTTSVPVGYVSLTASPASVNVNSSSTLTWSPSNVSSCTSFSLPASTWTGSKAIAGGTYPTPNLSTTTTYVINCTGYYGAASATTTVVVKQVPIITLTANPPSVALNSSSTLTWSVLNNVTSCTASGGWSGTKAITGGSVKTANLATATSYTLTCTGSGGTSATTTTVNVNQPAPTVTLTAASSSIPYLGSTTLTWVPTNATTCTAAGGSVYWNGSSLATTTTHWSTGISTTTYNYIINCTGPGGSASASTTVTVGVAPAPTLILTANPSSVAYGSTSIISWSSANTDSCLAGGTDLTYWVGSSTDPIGSWTTENLTESQTYSLTCTNEATHNSISTSTTVGVTNIIPIPVNISVDFNSIGVGGSCIVSGGGTFASGTPVTVTATPASGSLFNYWSDNGTQVSYSPSYSFIANANRTLTANCSAIHPVDTVTLYIGSSVSDATGSKWSKLRGPGGLVFTLVWAIPSIYEQDECVPTETYPVSVPFNQWPSWSLSTINSSLTHRGGVITDLSTAFSSLPVGTYKFKLSCNHTDSDTGTVTESTASTTLQLITSYSSEG